MFFEIILFFTAYNGIIHSEPDTRRNIALSRPVTAARKFDWVNLSLVVDGNHENGGNCALMPDVFKPFVAVHFDRNYEVEEMILYAPSGIVMTMVLIAVTKIDMLIQRAMTLCAQRLTVRETETRIRCPICALGRHLIIRREMVTGTVSLCEIEVYGIAYNATNVGLTRTRQIKIIYDMYASPNAKRTMFDGIKTSSDGTGWCEVMYYQSIPAFYLDFDIYIDVEAVVLYTMPGTGDIEYLKVEVWGQIKFVCVDEMTIPEEQNVTRIPCPVGSIGNYVYIQKRVHSGSIDFCEVEIYAVDCKDACSGNPCLNGGTCVRKNGCFYTCICIEPITDRNCRHACDSNPCKNGGTCEMDGLSYNCTCTEEYFGSNCQTIICSCLEEASSDGIYCVLRPLEIFPLSIICQMNCRTPASSREKLGLVAKCDDCAVSSNYSYTWHVDTNISWVEDTGTGRNARTFTVNANVLPVNQTFSFSVTVRGGPCSRKEANATYVMISAPPPTIGTCQVEPGQGMASKTLFRLTCEGFYDVFQPLDYMFFFKRGNSSDQIAEAIMLGSAKIPAFNKTLPVGNVKKNFSAIIEVRVRNSVGETNSVDIPVITLPLPHLKESSIGQMADETVDTSKSGGANIMMQLINAGKMQDALTYCSTMASAVRHASDVANKRSMQRKRTKLYNALVSSLKKVQVRDITNVNLKLQCLLDVTDIEDDLSNEAKEDVLTMYEDMAKFLLHTAYTIDSKDALTESSELIKKAERALFVGSTGIMKTSMAELGRMERAAGVVDDIEDSYTLKRKADAKAVIIKASSIVNDVISEVALSRQLPGESETVLKTNSFALGVQKDMAYDLGNKNIVLPLSGCTGIKIPNLHGSNSACAKSDELTIKIFQSSANMYTWDKSSSNVTTGVIEVRVQCNNNERTKLTHFSDDVFINIPFEDNVDFHTHVDVHVDVEADNLGNRDIGHFTSTVETNKVFHITFTQPAGMTSGELLLVLKKDSYSMMKDFFGKPKRGSPAALFLLDFGDERSTTIVSSMDTLGIRTSVTETNNSNTLIVSGIVTHGPPKSRLYFGVLPPFYDITRCKRCEEDSKKCGFCREMSRLKSRRSSTLGAIHLTVTITMQDCLYWDSQREIWTNYACKVSLRATSGYIVCQCSHLSVFGGSLLIAPNKVEFLELKLFLGFFQNPIVISLLIAFWCLYFLLTVWARRKDGTDKHKAALINLNDNEDEANYHYLVTVLTGWKNGGGTTSAVAFYISGNEASTKTHVIFQPDIFMLETGSEKWFLLATKQSLGDLRTLTVWLSSSGLFPSWFLNQITVRDVQTDEYWHFVCNEWLTPEGGMRNIKRTLVTCHKANLAYRFGLKASQVIRDQHLWLSIFCRPAHSLFTRVQRVACAMSYIMLAMATTIMFYGEVNSDNEFYLETGGYHFNLKQIIIGLESLMITATTNIFLVLIFRNVQTRWNYTKVQPTKTQGNYEHDGIDESNTGIQDRKRERRPKRFKQWLYYTAWFLATSSAIAATYVTALYSMNYGYTLSMRWTVSFVSAFVENVVIMQPIKVSFIAALFSFFIGRSVGPATPPRYYVDEVKDPQTVSKVRKRDEFHHLPPKHMYRLPDPWVVQHATHRMQREGKMWRTLHATAIGVLLLALLVAIAYGNTDRCSFFINKSIIDTFVKARHSGDSPLMKVQTRDDAWQYIKHTLIPAFHHNGTKYISDETNILIGSVIIRQVRAESKSYQCEQSESYRCKKFCGSLNEDTQSYKATWENPISQDLVIVPHNAWTYQSADALQIGPITCRHRTYPGGGYVFPIRSNRIRMMRLIQDLEDAHWLNNNTRAVLVQFTTFNPTTSLFTISLLAFEFMNVGVVEPYHDINTCKLYSFTNMRDVNTILYQICYVILILLYIRRAFRSFLALRGNLRRYFLNVWTYVDWVIILLVYGAVAVFVFRITSINRAVKLALKHRTRYVGFHDAAFYETIFKNILASTISVFVMKTFNLLYASKRALLKTSMLKINMKYAAICTAGIVLTVTLTLVGASVVYGASCDTYSHLSSSIMSTANFALFRSNLADSGCVMRADLSNLVFSGIVVFIFLPSLLLVIISLLVITASHIHHVSHLDNQGFFHVLFGRLLLMLGFWNITEYTEHMHQKKH